MPRKRPTETSWDSDEDLLEDESITLNSWSFDKELEGVDEDALLGGDDSENFTASTSSAGRFSSMNKSSAREGASSYNDPNEEYFQIPSYDDIPPQTDNQVDRYGSSEVDFSDIFVTDNTSDIIGSEPDQSFVAVTEKVARTSYEESDSDEEDGSRCGRFKSERSSTNTAALPKKTADKSEIPDTLEISNEDQQKIDKFMQTSQKKQKQFAGSRQQKGLCGSRPLLRPPKLANYGRQVPSNPTGFPFQNPAMVRPMHERQIGFSQGIGQMRHPGNVMQRPKVLVNPRFCRPQYLARQRMGYASSTEQQKHQNAPLPPSLLGLKSEPFQSFQQPAQDTAPLFPQQGAILPDHGQQLSNSVALQQCLPADQCGYSVSHSTNSFGFQRQQRPGLLPLPSHLMPSNVVQPVEVPFNHQRSSVPAMVLCQQPPIVANSKPELLAPPVQQVVTVRSSQIGFLGAPITQQPLQSNGVVMGPVMQQMPHQLPQPQVVQHVAPAQVRFIAAAPPANPANVDVLRHRIEQIPPQNFNAAANVGQHRLSAPPVAPSLSGYQSLGHTFSRQEPEAIGQRIETVIHARSLPHQVPKKPSNEVQRKSSVERQKQQPVSAVPNQILPASTSPTVQECSVAKEIEQKQKMEARARRFAAPVPAAGLKDKGISGSNVSSVNHLAVKRLSDQGTGGSAIKQARLTASRKVVARATAVLQQRRMLHLKQQQLQHVPTSGINIEQQSGGDSNQLLLSTSTPPKVTEVGEAVAPQRKVSVPNRTVIIADSDQRLPVLEKNEKIADSPDVAAEEGNYDADYQAKLQAQKKLREEILRKKELNRQRQALMRSGGTNEQLSQTVNGQVQQQSPVTNSPAPRSANPVSASPNDNTVRAAGSTASVQFRSSRPQVAMRAPAPSQLQNRATFQQRNITVPVVRPVTGRQPLTNFRKTFSNPAVRPLPSHHMSFNQQLQNQQRLSKPDHARLPVAQSFAQPMLRRTVSASNQRMNISQNTKSYAPNIQQQYHVACAKLSGLSAATNALTIRRLAENIGPVQDIQLNMRDKTATVWFVNPGHALVFASKYQRHMIDLAVISITVE